MTQKTGSLNIQRNLFLEKEEISQLQDFITNNVPLFLFENSTEAYGIIETPSLSGNEFLIEVGTNAGTVKLDYESYAIDVDMNLIYAKPFDNLPIPTQDQWYWLKLEHKEYSLEDGTIDIATDGTVSGTGTLFQSLLRGVSTDKPTRIKIVNEAADGTITTSVNNPYTYEVTSIDSDTSMILSGDFTAESSMKYVVVGSYTLGTVLSTEQKEGLYKYNWADYEMVSSSGSGTKPAVSLKTEGEDYFWLAAAYWDSTSGLVTIVDKREDYWRLNFGDIIVSNKADIDASNLSAGNVTSWVSKLSVVPTASIDFTDFDDLLNEPSGFYSNSGAVSPSSAPAGSTDNYSVINVNNVGFSSSFQIAITDDGVSYVRRFVGPFFEWDEILTDNTSLKSKVVNIGAWDMDTNPSPSTILHGVTNGITKIESISVKIYNDTGSTSTNFLSSDLSGGQGGAISWNNTQVSLTRTTGGIFDGTSYNDGAINRGTITIFYTD